jgi:predicted DNA-binding protein (MmcQ/YjbR family)
LNIKISRGAEENFEFKDEASKNKLNSTSENIFKLTNALSLEMVKEWKVSKSKDELVLDLKGIKPGLYILNIFSDSENYSYHIVIE